MGPNGAAPLWQDPQRRLAIGSYTALVGVCLSDQLDPEKDGLQSEKALTNRSNRFFVINEIREAPSAAEVLIGRGSSQEPRKGLCRLYARSDGAILSNKREQIFGMALA